MNIQKIIAVSMILASSVLSGLVMEDNIDIVFFCLFNFNEF